MNCEKAIHIQKLLEEQKRILREREDALKETQITIDALEAQLEKELES